MNTSLWPSTNLMHASFGIARGHEKMTCLLQHPEIKRQVQYSSADLPILHYKFRWGCGSAKTLPLLKRGQRLLFLNSVMLQRQSHSVQLRQIGRLTLLCIDCLAQRGIRRTVAIGMENGEILIYATKADSLRQWSQVMKLDTKWVLHSSFVSLLIAKSSIAHVNHIYSLEWRPKRFPYQLASCSDDGTVRITDVHLDLI